VDVQAEGGGLFKIVGRRQLTLQIKKNTAPHELKPSDILIERFTAWKQIVKMLICMSTARTRILS
jgi:hypothetical protein